MGPSASTLCPLSFPHRKALELICCYTQNEAQNAFPFPGYWWLFRTQHVSRYGTRKKGRKKQEEKEQERRSFNYFWFATLNSYYTLPLLL